MVATNFASGLCPRAIRKDFTKDKGNGKTSFDDKSAQHHNVLHHKEYINTRVESSKAISNKVSESTLLDTLFVSNRVDSANNERNNEMFRSAQHGKLVSQAEHDKVAQNDNTHSQSLTPFDLATLKARKIALEKENSKRMGKLKEKRSKRKRLYSSSKCKYR